MTSWATSLPGEILVRLRKALRGTEGIVTDGDFYAALTDELWERAGEDVAVASDDGAGGWPTRVVRHSGASTFITIVRFCRDASGPLDPQHTPVRRRLGAADMHYYECSCGARGDESHVPAERRTKTHPLVPEICTRRQRLPGRFWWPLVGAIDLGELGGAPRCSSRRESPRYLVCPFAETVDTLDHAPAKILDRLHWCICGCTYVRPGVDSLYRAGKFLDAF